MKREHSCSRFLFSWAFWLAQCQLYVRAVQLQTDYDSMTETFCPPGHAVSNLLIQKGQNQYGDQDFRFTLDCIPLPGSEGSIESCKTKFAIILPHYDVSLNDDVKTCSCNEYLAGVKTYPYELKQNGQTIARERRLHLRCCTIPSSVITLEQCHFTGMRYLLSPWETEVRSLPDHVNGSGLIQSVMISGDHIVAKACHFSPAQVSGYSVNADCRQVDTDTKSELSKCNMMSMTSFQRFSGDLSEAMKSGNHSDQSMVMTGGKPYQVQIAICREGYYVSALSTQQHESGDYFYSLECKLLTYSYCYCFWRPSCTESDSQWYLAGIRSVWNSREEKRSLELLCCTSPAAHIGKCKTHPPPPAHESTSTTQALGYGIPVQSQQDDLVDSETVAIRVIVDVVTSSGDKFSSAVLLVLQLCEVELFEEKSCQEPCKTCTGPSAGSDPICNPVNGSATNQPVLPTDHNAFSSTTESTPVLIAITSLSSESSDNRSVATSTSAPNTIPPHAANASSTIAAPSSTVSNHTVHPLFNLSSHVPTSAVPLANISTTPRPHSTVSEDSSPGFINATTAASTPRAPGGSSVHHTTGTPQNTPTTKVSASSVSPHNLTTTAHNTTTSSATNATRPPHSNFSTAISNFTSTAPTTPSENHTTPHPAAGVSNRTDAVTTQKPPTSPTNATRHNISHSTTHPPPTTPNHTVHTTPPARSTTPESPPPPTSVATRRNVTNSTIHPPTTVANLSVPTSTPKSTPPVNTTSHPNISHSTAHPTAANHTTPIVHTTPSPTPLRMNSTPATTPKYNGSSPAGTTNHSTPPAGITNHSTPPAGTTNSTPPAGTTNSTPPAGTTNHSTPHAGTTNHSTPHAGTTNHSTPPVGTTNSTPPARSTTPRPLTTTPKLTTATHADTRSNSTPLAINASTITPTDEELAPSTDATVVPATTREPEPAFLATSHATRPTPTRPTCSDERMDGPEFCKGSSTTTNATTECRVHCYSRDKGHYRGASCVQDPGDSRKLNCKCNYDPCRNSAMDIVFLLDSSGSLEDWGFEQEVDFLRNFISKMTLGQNESRVALVQFSTGAEKIFGFLDPVQSQKGVKEALDNLYYDAGDTNITAAFVVAVPLLESTQRPGVPQIAILVTDGIHNQGPPPPTVPSSHLREEGVLIYAVGIGPEASRTQLTLITGDANNVFMAQFSNLNNVLDIIGAEVTATVNN